MHLLMVAADARLKNPRSDVFARHAAYAAALAARRPGARLSVLVPGMAGAHQAGPLTVCARAPDDRADAVTAQAPWSALAWRLAARHRAPFLAQLHFDPFAPATAADRARALLARFALEKASRIRVMAPATAEALARHWRIDPARIWVAPVPIRWPASSTVARENLVVGAMRFAADRAPLGWIAVARRIAAAAPGVRFVLAGDGPLRAQLERAASGLPVSFPGMLEEDALAALLGRATVFLHAAPHEAFGRAIAEALAAGLPVVARATTGAAHLVQDGTTGLLCRDEAGLAEAALALLADPARAAAMGQAAHADAAARLVPEAMQARVIDFLLGERSCATC